MNVSRRSIASLTTLLAIDAVVSASVTSEAEAAQPSIDAALRSLYAAKRGILTSLPRKDGHRNRALKHLEQAIHEPKLYMTV